MITFEQVLNYLANADKDEVSVLFFRALVEEKVNYQDLSNGYVKFLELRKQDYFNQIIEGETCVTESLIYDTIGEDESSQKSVQRRLYLLNNGHRINCEDFNTKFSYIGDDKAKELSWYERNKNNSI